jgi:hypothetical protein
MTAITAMTAIYPAPRFNPEKYRLTRFNAGVTPIQRLLFCGVMPSANPHFHLLTYLYNSL